MSEIVTKKCDELKCLANTGKGQCRINTCALIDPEQAIIEFSELKLDEKDLANVRNWLQKKKSICEVEDESEL